MDPDVANEPTDTQRWESLLKEQTALFKETTTSNESLRQQVEELEREVAVWKLAHRTSERDVISLKKNVCALERNIGSLKDDNPLVVCLIDGDGNIFSSELVSLGRSGGVQAAQLLTRGLSEHLSETEAENDHTYLGRVQIWLSIFFNKAGLQDTLISHQICTAEQFEAFTVGFNQASPMFSLIDVGNGKEAADSKIKEYLRVFTRFPQTVKVFFGGGHDNGYATVLSSLNNEGLLHKVVLIKGYKELAYELRSFDIPAVYIPGLFMAEKLAPSTHKRSFSDAGDTEWPSRPWSRLSLNASPSKPKLKLDQIPDTSPTRGNGRNTSRPCNFFYLAVCKAGTACRFRHDVQLSPEELTSMKAIAKKSPCGHRNKNKPCSFGERCPLGHVCPKGPACSFYRQGRCKFVGDDMHSGSHYPTSRSTSGPSLPHTPIEGVEHEQSSNVFSPTMDSPSIYHSSGHSARDIAHSTLFSSMSDASRSATPYTDGSKD